MKCVLVGNYGVGNIGDEALREYFLTEFPEIEWIVVSASPHGESEVPRLPFGLRSLIFPWWRTIAAIRSADALVFGGGSLFTDIESVWACLLWRSYAWVATLFRTPYFLAFQGAGPWKTALGRRLARTTYLGASFISVRDAESLKRVRDLGGVRDPVHTFDPAFALFARHQKTPVINRTLVVIPRANSSEQFFASVSEKLQTKWDAVLVLLMEPQEERGVAERLQTMCPECTVVEIASVRQLLAEVTRASEAVVQRFHGALAALALGVPFAIVPQAPADKMAALAETVKRGGVREEWLSAVGRGANALRAACAALS